MKIAQFGTFDVENFGDLLFPLILRYRLRDIEGLQFEHVSPVGGEPIWADCVPSISIRDFASRSSDFGCVFIGGGNIIHANISDVGGYRAGGGAHYADLWLGASLAAAPEAPVMWLAPGLAAPLPRPLTEQAHEALQRASILAVRDEISQRYLQEIDPDADVLLVPDTAWEVNHLWTEDKLRDARHRAFTDRGHDVPERIAVLHLNTRYFAGQSPEDVAHHVDEIAEHLNATPVLVALGPCHGDDITAQKIALLAKSKSVVLEPRSLSEVVGCLSNSVAYIGSSMHGFITAAAFGIPPLLVGNNTQPKLSAIARQSKIVDPMAESWREAAALIGATDMAARAEQALRFGEAERARLESYWREVEGVVRSVLRKGALPAGGDTYAAFEKSRTESAKARMLEAADERATLVNRLAAIEKAQRNHTGTSGLGTRNDDFLQVIRTLDDAVHVWQATCMEEKDRRLSKSMSGGGAGFLGLLASDYVFMEAIRKEADHLGARLSAAGVAKTMSDEQLNQPSHILHEIEKELARVQAVARAQQLEIENYQSTIRELKSALHAKDKELASILASFESERMNVREVLKARAANAQAIFVRGIRQAGSALARNLTLLKRDRWRIAHSAMFDASWYRQQYPDVAASGVDPATHYLVFGAREGRNPHPSFDTKWYLGRYPDVAKSGINPLLHYLSIGQKEGRAPSPSGVPAAQRKSTFSEADDIALLKASPLFDAVWYLSEYGDVARAKADPVRHYLRHGAKEMRDPGPSFSTSWYLDKYRDVKRAGMNPLVHYLRYGQKEGRFPAPATAQRPWWEGLRPSSGTAASSVAFGETLTRLRKNALPPAVIVPVYNAAKEVDECLEALLTHTRGQARIIIIDDASPAPEVKEVLSRYEAEGSVEIYRNENNLGFTRTVNRGIELAGRADVVFLNSDTKVTPGWLLNLRVAAYSGEKIGTVTPLSNNAGAFSAPEIGKNNELPKWLTLDEYARAITHASARLHPSTPTGNGFCMYVRRDCLDEVGLLDANAFPRGYGEENDLCMRAVRKGWSHIVDDSTLIYHVRSASFGEEKVRLMAEGRAVVDQRYPEYGELVKKFVSGEPLKLARQRVHDIQRTLASSKQVALPRVLFVLSTRTGGTPQTNQDLMQALDDRVEAFVLRCNATILTLSHFRDGVYTEVERHILSNPLKAFPHRSDEYDAVVGEWMVRYAIELVHVRHIGWHGLGLIEVAKTLGRPVVFSFHDFYTVCPTVKLLDDKNEYCGGVCTASRGECRHELWPSRGFPALKGAAITQWRTSMEEVLKLCDVFITTAESAKEIISRTYPFLRERPFHVIPHGRDFDRFEKLTPQIESDTKIRIVIPGNISVAKGGKIIEELGRRASEENLEIHILGNVGKDLVLSADVISHGAYTRDRFADKIREIRPHIGGVFSIWPETYCHTLTELWSCGIPVIAFDYGAVGDRMKESGAGWLVQDENASGVFGLIRRLREDPAEYARGVECVARWQNIVAPRSTCLRMSHAYYGIYRSLVLRKDWEARPRAAVISQAEL